MKVEEIWDRIRVRSGQFILNKSKIELDVDNFKTLVEDALAEYNRSRPYDKTYTVFIGTPRHFTFTDTFDTDIKRIPEQLAEVTPITAFASNPYLYGNAISNPNNSYTELIDPLQVPWDYKKPTLVVPLSGNYKVVAMYNHQLVQVTEDTGNIFWEVTTISLEDVWFFKLLQGMFLQGIGRSRRAFTLSDMPILMDADQLYSEGQQIEEKALEEIHANKKIYLSMR